MNIREVVIRKLWKMRRLPKLNHTFNTYRPKMVKHTLKMLQQMLQDIIKVCPTNLESYASEG